MDGSGPPSIASMKLETSEKNGSSSAVVNRSWSVLARKKMKDHELSACSPVNRCTSSWSSPGRRTNRVGLLYGSTSLSW